MITGIFYYYTHTYTQKNNPPKNNVTKLFEDKNIEPNDFPHNELKPE